MEAWQAYLVFIIFIIMLSYLGYRVIRHKNNNQKGMLGLQLTLLGGLVLVLYDERAFILDKVGYILIILGTALTLWATVFSKNQDYFYVIIYAHTTLSIQWINLCSLPRYPNSLHCRSV